MAVKPVKSWKARQKQWLRYLQKVTKAVESGIEIPLGPSPQDFKMPRQPRLEGTPARVLLCSPHPDDECLSGAVQLRLLREGGAKVTNCAITLGSNPELRPRRLNELEHACRAIGFDLIVPLTPQAFERVNPDNRLNHPEEWAQKVSVLAEVFDKVKPDVVVAPHVEDFNTTHIGTHHLAVDALGVHLEKTGRGPVMLIEVEFWHQHSHPNLMVGVTPEDEAILLLAATEHGGEMDRNPYHLLHPALMMDNVRRGSEVVGGQGGPAYKFAFAQLAHVAFMKGKEIVPPKSGGKVIGPEQKLTVDLLRELFLPAA